MSTWRWWVARPFHAAARVLDRAGWWITEVENRRIKRRIEAENAERSKP